MGFFGCKFESTDKLQPKTPLVRNRHALLIHSLTMSFNDQVATDGWNEQVFSLSVIKFAHPL